jgi:hypothetical protein
VVLPRVYVFPSLFPPPPSNPSLDIWMKRSESQGWSADGVKQIGDTTKAVGDNVKAGTDSIGGKKQTAENPLGL